MFLIEFNGFHVAWQLWYPSIRQYDIHCHAIVFFWFRFSRMEGDGPRLLHGELNSSALLLHGGRGHVEGALPGVAELHLATALDPAAVADEVVVALPAEQLCVDGD